jgi:hypothetical protein
MPTVHYISRETLRKHGIGHIPWELMNKNVTGSSDSNKKQRVMTTNASVTSVKAEVVTNGLIRINATGTARGSKEQQPPYSLTTTNDNTVPSETKHRKRCSHGGCTNFAQKGGVCVIHGAMKTYCQNEGCTNKAVKGGVCITHGAKTKRCRFEGCTNKAVKGGVCITHGAKVNTKKRCNFEGCTNGAVKGGVCITHGAKTKRCSFEGCTNKAVKGGVCVTHGANMKQCGPEECKEAHNIGVNTNCKNNCTRLTFNCIHK